MNRLKLENLIVSRVNGSKATISLNPGLPPEAELFLEKIFFIFPPLFRTEKYLENEKYFLRKWQHF